MGFEVSNQWIKIRFIFLHEIIGSKLSFATDDLKEWPILSCSNSLSSLLATHIFWNIISFRQNTPQAQVRLSTMLFFNSWFLGIICHKVLKIFIFGTNHAPKYSIIDCPHCISEINPISSEGCIQIFLNSSGSGILRGLLRIEGSVVCTSQLKTS